MGYLWVPGNTPRFWKHLRRHAWQGKESRGEGEGWCGVDGGRGLDLHLGCLWGSCSSIILEHLQVQANQEFSTYHTSEGAASGQSLPTSTDRSDPWYNQTDQWTYHCILSYRVRTPLIYRPGGSATRNIRPSVWIQISLRCTFFTEDRIS